MASNIAYFNAFIFLLCRCHEKKKKSQCIAMFKIGLFSLCITSYAVKRQLDIWQISWIVRKLQANEALHVESDHVVINVSQLVLKTLSKLRRDETQTTDSRVSVCYLCISCLFSESDLHTLKVCWFYTKCHAFVNKNWFRNIMYNNAKM